jgi:hypothetical protein
LCRRISHCSRRLPASPHRRRGDAELGRRSRHDSAERSTEDAALGRFAAEKTAEYATGAYEFVVLENLSHWVPEDAAHEVNPKLLEHLGSSSPLRPASCPSIGE